MATNGSSASTTRNSGRLWNVQIPSITGEANYFDSSRFRTCCGCHVRTLAFVIGILETIALVAAVIATALAYVLLWQRSSDYSKELLPLDHHATLSLIGSLAALVFGLLAVIMLFAGLAKERPCLLIPHMIVQFIAVIGLLAAVVVFGYVAAVAAEEGATHVLRDWKSRPQGVEKPDYRRDKRIWPHIGSGRMFIYSILISSLCLVATALEIYFLVAIYRAYAYFCAKREELKRHSGPVKLWSTESSIRGGGDDSVIAARIWSED